MTAGSPVTLSQVVDTPPVPFTLEFDHRFDTITSSLDVLIDFQLVDTITAPASLVDDLTHHVIPIDPLSGLIGLEDVQLAFRMDGGTGDTVLVDNIMFVPEPASAVMMTMAAAAMLARRRRSG